LKSFIEKNPFSVYVDRALYNLSFVVLYNNSLADSSYIQDCLDFLQNNPDSYCSKIILENTLITYAKVFRKSSDELKTFLQDLIDKYPGTKLQEFAQNSLDEHYIKYIVK
jgi:hypothetical protein